jgi:integrase
MCSSAARTASLSGLQTGGSEFWDPAVAAAGLTGLTPYDLRHTAASLAIASGASVKHVQRMLGHKDAAMTLNVYASLFEDDLDDVSNRLDAALLEAAAACVRPEPSAEIIELPERTALISSD